MARQPRYHGDEKAASSAVLRGDTRALAVLVVLGLAFGTAACGGSPAAGVASAGSGTTTTALRGASGETPYQQALAYSRCMRTHGVPAFPDPDAQGDIRMSSSGSGVDALSPQYQAAARTCQKLEPVTGHSTAPPGAQLLPEWLKFAACMRAHGIVDYPDPKPIGNYGVMVQIPKSLHIDQSSPQFLAAGKVCQPLLKGNVPGSGGP